MGAPSRADRQLRGVIRDRVHGGCSGCRSDRVGVLRLKTDLGVFLQIFFCSICKMGMWVGLQKKPGLREGFVACKELVGWRHRFFCMAAAAKPRGAARSAAEGEPLMPKGYDGH